MHYNGVHQGACVLLTRWINRPKRRGPGSAGHYPVPTVSYSAWACTKAGATAPLLPGKLQPSPFSSNSQKNEDQDGQQSCTCRRDNIWQVSGPEQFLSPTTQRCKIYTESKQQETGSCREWQEPCLRCLLSPDTKFKSSGLKFAVCQHEYLAVPGNWRLARKRSKRLWAEQRAALRNVGISALGFNRI